MLLKVTDAAQGDKILKKIIPKILYSIGIFIAAALFTALTAASFGQDLAQAELEVDHALTTEVRTAHIQWAKPYIQGKTRALLFIGGRGTFSREGVELLQRFDIEGEAILYSRLVDTSRDDWHGGKEGLRRMAALLEKEWDAYLFLGIAPGKLPEPVRQKLIGKILRGDGLVLAGVDEPVLLSVAVENKDTIPFLAGIDGIKAFTPGKGRVVRLPARPIIEYAEGWQNAYESWQEGLGRALLWASGKEPRGRLSLALSKPAFPWSEPAEVTIRWDGGDAAAEKLRLQLWLRGPVGWAAPWPDRELAAGDDLLLTLPRLAGGRYRLDGRIVGTRGVEAWATVPFEVTSGRRIAGVELQPDWGESGGKITGSVALAGPAGPGERVRIDVLDKDRRVLLHREVPAGGDRVEFVFATPSWLPMLTTVEASLLAGGEATSKAYRYFRTTHRNLDHFNFLIWDVPGGTLAPYAQESLARTGVTLQLGQGNPPLHATAADLAWVPYTIHIDAKRDAKGVMTPFCWNDQKAVDANTRKIVDKHEPARRHGVFAYSLGDEIATQGACLAATCLEAYRNYLKEVYGTLEALNRSWGTDFGDWEAVGLSDPGDNEEKRSFEGRNYPRWFDRQAFKSWNFVQYAKKYAAAYWAMDPEARTGFEGAGRFEKGDDIDLIVRNLGFWSPYPGTTDEVIRSIAPRDFLRANWMGYTKDADSLLQKYWRMVTRGMDAVWWWRWECIGKFNGWLAPDFRPYPAVKEILADTRAVREGLGDLLLKSRMEDDGIAILYSYPSTFAHKLEEGPGFGEYEKSHGTWHKAIRDLGLQFSYVTDRMLRLGEFDAGRFKVLVLPRAEAIGEKEAAVIRAFVAGGGTVIADARPGIYDDHCKRREAGILDDLFGVRRKGFVHARKVARALADPGIEIAASKKLGNSSQLPTASEEIGGRPPFSKLGDTPVLIGRRVGKGYALLLNGDLNVLAALPPAGIVHLLENRKSGAGPDRKPGQPSISQSIDSPQFTPSWLAPESPVEPLGVLLEGLAGVRPATILRKEDGDPVRDVEVVRWRNGKNEILALFRQGGKTETVTVRLPRTAQVYDLRNRKALGETRIFKTAILPNRASFFVLTPKPAPPIKIGTETYFQGSDPQAVPAPPERPAAVAAKTKTSGGKRVRGEGAPAPVLRGQVVKVMLSVPGAQGDHAVLVTARFPKPSAEPPRSGAFFPRTGYPVMPAEFRKSEPAGKGGTASDNKGTFPNFPAPDVKAAPADDFVYPGVDSEKGEFLKRVEILGREPVTVDVPIAYNDPPGTYELTVKDLFTQKTVTRTWRVQ
jgi:beta-galactosidase